MTVASKRGAQLLLSETYRQSWLQRLAWKDWGWAVLLLLPTFIGLGLSYGSVIWGFFISLTSWDILTPMKWVLFDNYVKVFSDDELFRKCLVNTAYYTVGTVPLGTALSLFVAVLMNQPIRLRNMFRVIFFLPSVTSGTAIALLWAWLYNPQFGLLNFLLKALGLPSVYWLGNSDIAMPAIMLMAVWRGLGYNVVLFLAGLQGVPQEFYEAAKLDGAGRWKSFWNVTFPLISPTTFFIVVLSIIGSFQVFEATYVMTLGGPNYATYTMVLYIFQEGFQWFRMGYASSMAYVLFAIILFLTLIQFRFERQLVHYEL